ncbi:hypothetical protein [Actinokineospora cianjurensis]|uniref:Aminotransferase class V n=1 Tax=Actinokineospora cianjurensis TaxID=585224 RepID=A0A421B0H6_9PSEU|nr:hypothetical protein [Actinokineospora cianjurensis]RLK55585.1 hypothetical protein CLV68_5074 [Actinokineospora cianjurensis]
MSRIGSLGCDTDPDRGEPKGRRISAGGTDLLTGYGIEIGAGAGAFASSVWRIGLMGHNARPDRVELVLAALRAAIAKAGA